MLNHVLFAPTLLLTRQHCHYNKLIFTQCYIHSTDESSRQQAGNISTNSKFWSLWCGSSRRS